MGNEKFFDSVLAGAFYGVATYKGQHQDDGFADLNLTEMGNISGDLIVTGDVSNAAVVVKQPDRIVYPLERHGRPQ